MNVRQLLLGVSVISLSDCGKAELDSDALQQLGAPISLSDPLYELRAVHSGKCASVENSSLLPGARVVQQDCSGAGGQRWHPRHGADESYVLEAEHSGLCLSVRTDSAQDGLGLVQAACTESPNQKFRLVDSGTAVLMKPQTTGARNRKCMDVAASSKENQAPILQWSCHGLDNQRWTFVSATSAGGGGVDAGGGGSSGGGSGGTTVRYALDDTTNFANPERGFYHHHETSGSTPLSQSQLASYRTNEGISLVLRLYYLDAFRSSNISASYLSGMSADFDRVRAAGLKLVLRFAYSRSMSKPYGDAPKEQVLSHLAQLTPLLQAHADVIATVQAGFIGAWGEWYFTDHFGDQNSISQAQWNDRRAVVDALLSTLPASRTVQLRVPGFKQRFFGPAALTASEAFGGSPKARVGHHNDCFLATADDYGTYSNVGADKAYLATENLYVPQGGETCVTSAYSGWATASADLERLHYSYLNRDYQAAVLNSWGSNLAVVQRRLGYRLALLDSVVTAGAQPGGEIRISFSLRNDGYAAPYNPRGVEIIARNQATGTRLLAKLPVDARRWTPGAVQQIDARLCIPAGTPEGTYALALALPDPQPMLHNRPEYSIRLANSGLWDAGNGSNDLKQKIGISASFALTPCSSASVPLTAP